MDRKQKSWLGIAQDPEENTEISRAEGEPMPSRRQFVQGSAFLASGLVTSVLGGSATQAALAQGKGQVTAAPGRSAAYKASVVPCAPRPNSVVRKNINQMSDAEYKSLQDAVRIVRARPTSDRTSQAGQARIHAEFCDTPDPNMQVHFSWKFLPWHRGYLYFYESILQDAIKDTQLALPYWDWSKDFSIPARYWGSGNPLYDMNRVATPTSMVDPNRTKISSLLTLPLFSSFGGTPTASGQVETGPHNYIHNFIGGDMGSFTTAGLDPIFFSGHHSMIDRLWWMWMQDPSHQNPADPAWLGLVFSYYTTTGALCQIPVRDILKLSYSYTSDTVITASPKRELAVEKSPVVVELQRLTAEAVRGLREPRPRSVALLIEGVEVPTQEGADIEVYLNEPNARAGAAANSPSYAGYFSLVPLGHHHGKVNIQVNITNQLERLAATNGPATVTLVPVPVEKDRFLAGRVSFERISLIAE